jgi:hypothetical protein
VQFIIAAVPETACESDSRAIAKLIEHFDEHGHRPETLLADTAYGSDANFMACARNSPRSWFGPSHNEGTVNPVIELIRPGKGLKGRTSCFPGTELIGDKCFGRGEDPFFTATDNSGLRV